MVVDARRAAWNPANGIGLYVDRLLHHLPLVAPDLEVAAVRSSALTDASPRRSTLGSRARRWPAKLGSDLVELPIRMRSGRLRHFPYTENAGQRPWVVTVHDLVVCHPRPGDPFTGRYYSWRTMALALGAHVVMCPTSLTESALRAALGAGVHVRLVPYGADLPEPARPAEGHAPRRPYLFHPGGSSPRKNLPLLMDAWDRMRGCFDGDLLLTGRPEGPLALPPDVHFLGRVPRPELAWLYQQAVAVVYPSLEEGFGLPIVEAAALGRPVVCGRVGVVPELPEDAALVVDQGDPESFATGMRLAVEGWQPDPRATAAVRATYSWERCARETAAVYRECL